MTVKELRELLEDKHESQIVIFEVRDDDDATSGDTSYGIDKVESKADFVALISVG